MYTVLMRVSKNNLFPLFLYRGDFGAGSSIGPSDEGAVTAFAVTGGENKIVLYLSEIGNNSLSFLPPAPSSEGGRRQPLRHGLTPCRLPLHRGGGGTTDFFDGKKQRTKMLCFFAKCLSCPLFWVSGALKKSVSRFTVRFFDKLMQCVYTPHKKDLRETAFGDTIKQDIKIADSLADDGLLYQKPSEDGQKQEVY
ncbi:MAG: hypothetical protein ACI39E_05150 [Acutalibacteraceae bacterium]